MKAMGIDGIGPKILKHCALALFKPIHHLSITKHCLPTEWRFHLITPVYKSGDKSSVKNYRPICLLCIISKVLEKQNHSFFLQFNISITIWFQEETFNNAAVTCLFGSIYKSSGSNAQTDVIYLDFKKAFDNVAYGGLLVKLWSFGITGSLWKFKRITKIWA